MADPLPADWRTLGEPDPGSKTTRPAQPSADGHRGLPLIGLLAVVGGLLGVAGVVAVAWHSDPSEVIISAGAPADAPRPDGASALLGDAIPTTSLAIAEIVVDVEGAVTRPGLHRLAGGARVGDAIAAAGGFGLRVDAYAASRTLNLAEPLQDGAKVHVPVLGEAQATSVAAAGTPPAGGPPAPSGLVDINHADQALLETLPEIGPVTASAIIAARQAAPFATVDELRSREVVGPATFEAIRALVTVGGG